MELHCRIDECTFPEDAVAVHLHPPSVPHQKTPCQLLAVAVTKTWEEEEEEEETNKLLSAFKHYDVEVLQNTLSFHSSDTLHNRPISLFSLPLSPLLCHLFSPFNCAYYCLSFLLFSVMHTHLSCSATPTMHLTFSQIILTLTPMVKAIVI